MVITSDNIDEPLLLEESTEDELPPHTLQLLSSVDEQFHNTQIYASALLASLLYTVTMESGFTPVAKAEDCSNFSEGVLSDDFNIMRMRHFTKFPLCWDPEQKMYCIDFILSSAPDYICCLNLTCLPQNIFVAHFLIRNLQEENSHKFITVKTEDFIPNPYSFHAPTKFYNLKQFSVKLKDSVLSPVKQALLKAKTFPVQSFLGIPEEMKLVILKHLKVRDLLNVSETCQYFYKLCRSVEIWFSILKRDFPGSTSGIDKTNYDTVFNKYKSLKKSRKTICRVNIHPTHPFAYDLY